MKIILILILFTTLSCSAQKDIQSNKHLEKCSVIEETFEESQMKKYLYTASSNRDILNNFLEDENLYSYLSIIGSEIIYTYSSDGLFWNGQKNEIEFEIENIKIESLFKDLIAKNIVYKMVCPKNFVVYDMENEFQTIWVKSKGELKLLYYSTKCGTPCLDDISKSKIHKLFLLNEFFK